MATRTKLTIAYLGTPFHGWQRQPDRCTVQGEIERALTTMTAGLEVAVVGAGRTDAGVHAAGQIAHVDLEAPIPPDGLVRGLNAALPGTIRILSAAPASIAFHARRSACGKLYCYRARWRPARLPWTGLRAAVLAPITSEAALESAAALLVGEHDFGSFTVPEAASDPTVRRIFRVEVQHRRNGVDLGFFGTGFLRYQVRRMVGALLEVARGRLEESELRRMVDHPSPGTPLPTAPARGLTLEHVSYRSTTSAGGEGATS